MMESIVITGLLISLIGCNIFWAVVAHKLIDKLMSRTYWDYKVAKAIPKTEKEELADALSGIKVKENHPNEIDSLDQLIKTVMPLG